MGKTAVVDQLRPVVTGGGGWFVAGKFDQIRRDLEFDGVYQAFRALFQYDVKTWLSIGAEAKATLSPVYDSGYATAYVIFRLPVGH